MMTNDKIEQGIKDAFNEWKFNQGRKNATIDIKFLEVAVKHNDSFKGIHINIKDDSLIINDDDTIFLPLFVADMIGKTALDIRIKFMCSNNMSCRMPRSLILELRKYLNNLKKELK